MKINFINVYIIQVSNAVSYDCQHHF